MLKGRGKVTVCRQGSAFVLENTNAAVEGGGQGTSAGGTEGHSNIGCSIWFTGFAYCRHKSHDLNAFLLPPWEAEE